MRPPGGAVAVAAMVLPLIVLCKLWSGRRNSGDRNNDNASQKPDSTASSVPSEDTAGSSSAFLPMGEYEVFLSFRGPDTRDRITDILYRFLCRLKVHTFKDDEELRKGEGVWPGLVRAIDQSKIYVPIFSKNYAHSKWCLKELAEMVRRCHEPEPENRRPIILPIFYKVNPRDVRHQTGSYKEAFQQHQKKFDKRIIQEWKDALNEVGSLKGWHVKSDNEQGKYADLVLDSIWSHLRRLYDAVETDELVAIDGHVEEVVRRLSLESKDVTMVGLHGIGGIGKTTLAKAVYNKILLHFDRCSFLENIRETQQQHDGILKIQKKLIKDALRKEESVIDVSEGRRLIADRVSRFKILIILDDVDEKFKFEEILGDPRSFASGTRFIITSRNCKLLSTLNEDRCELFDVQTLSLPHSLQLFSKHAFKKDCPPPDYKSLSDGIVSTTGGLPLTLKVVGSLLYREGKSIWREKLMQLREMLERDVMDRLKISYDALEYEAKEIFLDIACLYIGEEKEMPFNMWSDCHFYPTNNINLLIQRSMIKIGDDNKFQMHDQLRDMGREIVRRENIEHPWMRSRIWTYEVARELLYGKKGTDQVKAIRLIKSSWGNEQGVELDSECFVNLSELRYFEAVGVKLSGDFDNLLPNLRWLRLLNHSRLGDDLINFHMKNLIILELRNSEVGNDWGGWTQIKIANKLKVLDLSNSRNLTKLPNFAQSGSLEVLYLRNFKGRIDQEELDIGKLRNLMVLNLRWSSMKRIVGGTIGMIEELRELDLCDCEFENLGQVLVDIDRLQSLQFLRTDRTKPEMRLAGKLPTGLKELSTSSPINNLSELIELEVLLVHFCGYGLEIPPADDNNNKWWKLSKLKILQLYDVSKMWSTNPSNSLLPSSLTSLTVVNCTELEWLPNLENLENLTVLHVEGCPLPREIQGLGGLKALKTLRIINATNLRQLDKVLCSLRCLSTLKLLRCGALERLSSLESLTNLDELHIQECPLLPEIEGIGGLTSLQELKITSVASLIRIDGLGNLLSSTSNKLKSLKIWYCPRLASLSLFQDQLHDDDDGNGNGRRCSRGLVRSLETLTIKGCTSLLWQWQDGLHLPHLSKFPMLKSLSLQDLSVQVKKAVNVYQEEEEEASSLEGLDCLEELVEMELGNLLLIERLPSLSKLENLEKLSITNMPRLQEIEGLAGLKSLQSLELTRCTSLERADGLSRLEKLKSVKIQGCTKSEKLPSLSNQGKLTALSVKDMPSLREIEELADLKSLQSLELTGCISLERVDGLSGLAALETVEIQGCTKLEKLPSLANLRRLRDLSIRDMSSLREMDDAVGLAFLTSLRRLNLTGCSSLERLTVNLPPGLKRLDVGGCTSLTNLSQLRNCLPRTSIRDSVSDDDLNLLEFDSDDSD